MKIWLDSANEYIKKWNIGDVALLKICVLSVGVILGLGISKRYRNQAAIAASVIFPVTYVLVMLPFLKLVDRNIKSRVKADA